MAKNKTEMNAYLIEAVVKIAATMGQPIHTCFLNDEVHLFFQDDSKPGVVAVRVAMNRGM